MRHVLFKRRSIAYRDLCLRFPRSNNKKYGTQIVGKVEKHRNLILNANDLGQNEIRASNRDLDIVYLLVCIMAYSALSPIVESRVTFSM